MGEFKYLVKISPEENNNRYYRMAQITDSIFEVEMGRIGAKPVKTKKGMEFWDSVLEKKIKEGYIDRSNLCQIQVNEVQKGYKLIEDPAVKELIDNLLRYRDHSLQEEYLISYDAVTIDMLNKAQLLIKELSCQKDEVSFNQVLQDLFWVLPRKMQDVNAAMAHQKKDMDKIVLREQSLLDSLRSKIDQEELFASNKGTILDALGLEIRLCNSIEENNIKKHMGSESRGYFKRAYRVRNKNTDERFYSYMKQNEISDIQYLYHGSKNQNYMGLISEGPKLNPDAPITGKMFGYGLYFANRAKKSINYTDLIGSYWNKGSSNTAYLAVYKVAYKNAKHTEVWEREMASYTKKKIAPYDALFAHKGRVLYNDEVIVYDEAQATLQYLVELHA